MSDTFEAAVIAADTAAGAAYAALMTVIGFQYVDLANNYYDLYKEQRNFYYNNFQAAGELPFNTELYAVPFYVPLYDPSGTYLNNGTTLNSSLFYYTNEVNIVANNFTETFQNHLRMFNSGDVNPAVPTFIDLSEIGDDWLSYMFRFEEHRRDVTNSRRFAQNMDSLSYGVKEGAMVERGLATSFLVFDEAQGQLVSSINTLADGYFGYSAYRKEVKEILETPKAIPDRIMGSNFDTSAGPIK